MDCQIYLNGTDITSEIVDYTRQQSLCSSIGTLTLSVKGESTRDFTPGGTLVVYEGGVKQGTYYINIQEKQVINNKTWVVSGQDGSKLLQDYFITESYTIDGTLTTSRYWLTRFLEEAGINYYYTTTEQGVYLPDLTALGMASLYDTMTPLLQNNGWFLYFNADNYAIIGKVETEPAADFVDDTEILEINRATDDQMLRNQAIVWGNYNPFTETSILANVTDLTGYEMSAQDWRPIVISNQFITTQAEATFIATSLLEQFSTLTDVKTIRVAGALNVRVADTISVSSDGWSGSGILTNMSVSMSKSGLITELTLDQRCPRLISYQAEPVRFFYDAPLSRNVVRWATGISTGEQWRSITSPDSYNTVEGFELSGYNQSPSLPGTFDWNFKLYFGDYFFAISEDINNIIRHRINGSGNVINALLPFIDTYTFSIFDENTVFAFKNSGDIWYIIHYDDATYDEENEWWVANMEEIVVPSFFSVYYDGSPHGVTVVNYKAYLDKNGEVHVFYTGDSPAFVGDFEHRYLGYARYNHSSAVPWSFPADGGNITPPPLVTNHQYMGIPQVPHIKVTETDQGIIGLFYVDLYLEYIPDNYTFTSTFCYFSVMNYDPIVNVVLDMGENYHPHNVTLMDLVSDYTNNCAYYLTYGGPEWARTYRINKIDAEAELSMILDSPEADGEVDIASSKNIVIISTLNGYFYQLPSFNALGVDEDASPGYTTNIGRNLDDDDDSAIPAYQSGTLKKINIYTGARSVINSQVIGTYSATILQGQFLDVGTGFLYPKTFATAPAGYSSIAGRIIY